LSVGLRDEGFSFVKMGLKMKGMGVLVIGMVRQEEDFGRKEGNGCGSFVGSGGGVWGRVGLGFRYCMFGLHK